MLAKYSPSINPEHQRVRVLELQSPSLVIIKNTKYWASIEHVFGPIPMIKSYFFSQQKFLWVLKKEETLLKVLNESEIWQVTTGVKKLTKTGQSDPLAKTCLTQGQLYLTWTIFRIEVFLNAWAEGVVYICTMADTIPQWKIIQKCFKFRILNFHFWWFENCRAWS